MRTSFPNSVPEGRLSFGAVQISELFGSVSLILLDELRLQMGFAKLGWATFVGVAVAGGKTEALLPGRV